MRRLLLLGVLAVLITGLGIAGTLLITPWIYPLVMPGAWLIAYIIVEWSWRRKLPW